MTLPRICSIPILLALLFSVSFSAGVFAQTEDRAAAIRKALHVDTFKNVDYFDENNKEITSEQFDERVRAGLYVSMEKSRNWFGSTVVKMRLDTTPKAAFKAKYNIKPGDQFPEFSQLTLANKTLDNKQLMGKYTLVSFYFADCPPCVDEVPELNTVASGRVDMNFIGITFDSVKTTHKFVDERKLAWTVLPDARAFIKTVGVQAFPTLALLDPAGKVLAIEVGGTVKASDKTIAAWVARLAPPVQ